MIGNFCKAFAVVGVLLASPISYAYGYGSNIFINGRELTMEEAARLQMQLGTPIASGYYVVNAQTGCWANLTNGASGCYQPQRQPRRHRSLSERGLLYSPGELLR
ncbi:MAG: hypothetical protein ACREBC_30730 [Pyrinomonadaceae bacterium]